MRPLLLALALAALVGGSARAQTPEDVDGASLVERAGAALARSDTAAAVALLQSAAAQGDEGAVLVVARLRVEPLFLVSAEVAPGVTVTAATVPAALAVPGPFECDGVLGVDGGTPMWMYTRIEVARGGHPVRLDASCMGQNWPVKVEYGLDKFGVEGNLVTSSLTDGAGSYFAAWDLRTGRRIYAGPPRNYFSSPTTFLRLLHYLRATTDDGPPPPAPALLGFEPAACQGAAELAPVTFESGSDDVTPEVRASVRANAAALGACPEMCALVAIRTAGPNEQWSSLPGNRATAVARAFAEAGVEAVEYAPGRDIGRVYAGAAGVAYVFAYDAADADIAEGRTFVVACPGLD